VIPRVALDRAFIDGGQQGSVLPDRLSSGGFGKENLIAASDAETKRVEKGTKDREITARTI
jgi:hypothetical protein